MLMYWREYNYVFYYVTWHFRKFGFLVEVTRAFEAESTLLTRARMGHVKVANQELLSSIW